MSADDPTVSGEEMIAVFLALPRDQQAELLLAALGETTPPDAAEWAEAEALLRRWQAWRVPIPEALNGRVLVGLERAINRWLLANPQVERQDYDIYVIRLPVWPVCLN